MVLKSPWKVLKFCYRIFFNFLEVGPGRVLLGTWFCGIWRICWH